MPEGHVIHRLAAGLTDAFAGRPVAVTSPQGRFPAAALLDGSTLTSVEALGKHLFLTFDPAALVHVHLGLIGRFHLGPSGPVQAAATLRLRLDDGVRVAELRGPQTCELLSEEGRRGLQATLGPDPLRADADPETGWRRVSRSPRPIASLLLDQRVAAGVGNIYRAEVLFRQRLNPAMPGSSVSRRTWLRVWSDLVTLMAEGVRTGRIDTVRPEHAPEATGRAPRQDRHGGEVYVYRRAGLPCLVCGRPVRSERAEGRTLYWCPRCQRLR